MEFIFATILGIIYSLIMSLVLFMRINDAKSGKCNDKVYYVSCIPLFLNLIFVVVSTNNNLFEYDIFTKFWLILFALLVFLCYFVFFYFEKTYLQKISSNSVYRIAKWYTILIVSVSSASTMSTLINCFIKACMTLNN